MPSYRPTSTSFSDQTEVTYISEEVKADSFADLVHRHDIRYSALNAFQKHKVGVLLDQELLVVEDDQLLSPNLEQIGVLSHIYYRGAAPFHRYSAELSGAAIALEVKGIVSFSSILLTPTYASYLNFWLNKSEFSDGPDLRNTYAHGTNPDPDQVDRHRFAYMSLLRLTIFLVPKFGMTSSERQRLEPQYLQETEGDALQHGFREVLSQRKWLELLPTSISGLAESLHYGWV